MTVKTRTLQFNTQGDNDIIDITEEVAAAVTETELQAGIITIFISGSTAGITTIEYEQGLISDINNMFDRITPQGIKYHHNKYGEGNGHSHMRASLLGASLSIPFSAGRLTLGIWQQIVLIDFDNRPRSRQVIIQILGE